jgi:threonine dehydrogenase-like Zn-dependent dehydrogenase
MENPAAELRALTNDYGFDDAFVFAPVAPIIEQADAILAVDGCLNFFAGPAKTDFKALFNFYNVHYARTHIVGTSGGNTDDMIEALNIMSEGLDPAGLVTHIGGINAVIDTTMNLPGIPGGKKLIYTHIEMPLTPIYEFKTKGQTNPVYAELHKLCAANNGLWNVEAEEYLLANADKL